MKNNQTLRFSTRLIVPLPVLDTGFNSAYNIKQAGSRKPVGHANLKLIHIGINDMTDLAEHTLLLSSAIELVQHTYELDTTRSRTI